MSALRKTLLRSEPIPQLIPPWQRVQNPCPEHPNSPMRKVQVLGRELWECAHPSHITGEMAPVPASKQGTGGMRVNPIRLKGMAREQATRERIKPVAAPIYTLPAPAPRTMVGAMGPVPCVQVVCEAGGAPKSHPESIQPIIVDALADWPTLRPVQHPQLQDVSEQDCEPDLSEGDGENEPTALSRKVRDQRAIELLLGSAKEKESETNNAND